MTRAACHVKLVYWQREAEHGVTKTRISHSVSDAGRQSTAEFNAGSVLHLFSGDKAELPWLDALLDKLCRGVSSALTSSQIHILKMTHLVATCCHYPPKKSYVYTLFGLLMLVRSQYDLALHVVTRDAWTTFALPLCLLFHFFNEFLNPESLELLTILCEQAAVAESLANCIARRSHH